MLPTSPHSTCLSSRDLICAIAQFVLGFQGILERYLFWNVFVSGVNAYADPHTNKLRTQVVHIWYNRSRQPNQRAMEGPPARGTTIFIFHKFIRIITIKTGGVQRPHRAGTFVHAYTIIKNLKKTYEKLFTLNYERCRSI